MKFINLFIASIMWLFPLRGRAADAPQWSCDIYAYQYDMSIYIVIEDQGKITNEGKEVAVFYQEECRGIAELQSAGEQTYFYVRARSNETSGEVLTFKVFDSSTGKEITPSATLAFEAQQQIGFPSDPFVLTLPEQVTPEEVEEAISSGTEEILAEGTWQQKDMENLANQIHENASGEQGNTALKTVDMSNTTFDEDVTLKGIFSDCGQLTAVILPDELPSTISFSPDAFKGTNPNCIVYLPAGTTIPDGWADDVNVVVGNKATSLTLYEHNPYQVKRPFTVDQCIYKRTFGDVASRLRSGSSTALELPGWKTICVPFPVNKVQIEDKELFPITNAGEESKGDYYKAVLGADGFEIVTEYASDGFYFDANIPCLVNMTSASGEKISGTVDFIYNKQIEIEISTPTHVIESSDYTLTGVYESTKKSHGIYALNDNGDAFENELRAIYPFEAYLTTTLPGKESIPVSGWISVTGVTINPDNVSVKIGKTVQLSAVVLPENASDPSVIWKSSNNAVATVSSTGLVTGIKEGTTDITVTTQDGNLAATCKVTVEKEPVDPGTEDPDNPGGEDPDNPGGEDPDEPGTEDPDNPEPGDPDEPEVEVTGVSLAFSSLELKLGDSSTLKVNIQPANASNKGVTWHSSDPTVVTVDAQGKLTAIKRGSATITVTTNDGEYTDTCLVVVVDQLTLNENIETKEIVLYPTIVDQRIHISGLRNQSTIQIISFLGQHIETWTTSERQFIVDASKLRKGYYIVVVSNDNNKKSFKILKK